MAVVAAAAQAEHLDADAQDRPDRPEVAVTAQMTTSTAARAR
jgi:hypothetical protein